MTFSVEFSSLARRALTDDLPESAAIACWEFIMGVLVANPHRVGKPLRGQLEGRYSARRGEFRVIYQIVEDRVLIRVIHIAHRRDVYR